VMFPVELASSIDLSKCHVDAKLYYDFDRDDSPKVEVGFVKSEPMESRVNVYDGTKATVEIKMKVLTSQHEDMLFRIRFSAFDSTSRQEHYIFSQPIKVVSKVTPQLKRRESKENVPLPVHANKLVKRASSEMIVVTLEKLERQQDEHSKILALIQKKLFPDETPHELLSHHSLHETAEIIESFQMIEEGRQKAIQSHQVVPVSNPVSTPSSAPVTPSNSNENGHSNIQLPVPVPTQVPTPTQQVPVPAPHHSPLKNESTPSSSNHQPIASHSPSKEEFDSSFNAFLVALNSVRSEERQERIDSFIHRMNVTDEKVTELSNLLNNKRRKISSNESNPIHMNNK